MYITSLNINYHLNQQFHKKEQLLKAVFNLNCHNWYFSVAQG